MEITLGHTYRWHATTDGSPACDLYRPIGLQLSDVVHIGLIDFVTFRRRHSLLSTAISVRSFVFLLLVVKLNAVCVTQLKQLIRLNLTLTCLMYVIVMSIILLKH